jgi:ParB family chromosome partitioning protein
MRKNLLTVKSEAAPAAAAGLGDYARRGASRSMMLSIDEMAENAKKALSGKAVIELDAALVDPSFLRDRVEDDEASFAALKESVETQGQLQPVLVRPHPDAPGRYMLVFGHRRARAARELGLPLRAIVKNIEEINHIIVQGQENSRRADLTYIERCLLARKLLEMSHSKETIRAALGIDDTTLSRMVSLAASLPGPVIDAIGSGADLSRSPKSPPKPGRATARLRRPRTNGRCFARSARRARRWA